VTSADNPSATDPDAIDEASRHVDEDALSDPVPGRDGGPIDESDMEAADGLSVSDDVAENYEDMTERGAKTAGEGRV
jgi:hypothetical protein